MSAVLYGALSTISFINIIVHTIGLYLLLCIQKNYDENVQQIYITNLSVVEIFGSILWFISDLNKFIVFDSIKPYPYITHVNEYVSFVTCTVFLFVYYMSMVLITIDKFLEIFLNIKYNLYCSAIRAKYLVYLTWVLGCFFCIGIILACKIYGLQYQLPFIKFVYPAFDIFLILIVVVCYSYIFHRYKATRSHPFQRQDSTLSVFLKSKFYISFLLILTFMCLVVIPDLTYLFSIMENKGRMKSPGGFLLVLYHISFLSDAWIYIFLQSRVRKLLLKKVTKCINFLLCFNMDDSRENRKTKRDRITSSNTEETHL